MKKQPQNTMTAEQKELVAEKLADLFCNLIQNHPELLEEYVMQQHAHKRSK
jgi:hypothetical protein